MAGPTFRTFDAGEDLNSKVVGGLMNDDSVDWSIPRLWLEAQGTS
jgi:hypothetical protein